MRRHSRMVVSDNGITAPIMTLNAMLTWQADQQAELHYIAPRKPMHTALWRA